ncbi:MAG: Ig-like domain-containing protein, partial [Burkholderiales bacterium]
MSTMTFQVNDASTSGGYPAVWVTITENADGTLTFNVTQEGGIVGDLRGLFFDIADESILKTLVITAASTDIRIGDDSIKDLGDGSNMNGLTGSDKGYDLGIEIGTAGIGKDDIQSYTFTLDSPLRDLTLNDFSNVDFGVRLTSVGVVGGSRADSSKILEITSQAADAKNDVATVDENQTASGNVLGNDTNGGGTTTVTGWSGGAVGQQVALSSENERTGEKDIIGTVQLNADGSFTVDASAADELSAGESIAYTFNYDIKNQTEDTSFSTDTATFTVVVNGKNDGPVAVNDSGSVNEDATASGGSVVANDTDVDRLDTKSFVSWADGSGAKTITNAAGATATLNADGTWSLDASSADALSQGESISQSFNYTMSDNHGATSKAALTLTVNGVNDGPVADDDNAGSITEDEIANGTTRSNDSDIDRLDSISVTALNGIADGAEGDLDADTGSIKVQLASGALVTMNADGTFSYDTNGAFEALNDGDAATDSFVYTLADNHGATDDATVTISIAGVTDGGGDNGGGGGDSVDPALTYLFNHGTSQ